MSTKLQDRVSLDRQAAIHELSELICELQSACQLAEQNEGQDCAELRSALVRTERLKKMLAEAKNSSVQWAHLTWVLNFLLKAAKLICSSNNCLFPQVA